MKLKVHQLKGMQEEVAGRLTAHGIHDSNALLEQIGNAKVRAEMAGKLNVDQKYLLELANRADLARVKGIGRVYADLLENAGVDTVLELSTRKPENLHKKLTEVAGQYGVKRIPRLDEVQSWVEQGKTMERKVHH